MDQEPGFYSAAQQVVNHPACISPLKKGLIGSTNGRAQIFSSDKVGVENGEGKSDGIVDERVRSTATSTREEDQIRQPRSPVTPGRPTKKEIEDHCVAHWPFRSWCRHCVMGRAQGSPHYSRGSDSKEFARCGPPTISMDHCFLGSSESDESALGSPFLILYDNASEALYCVACSTKACTAWVVAFVFSILCELGYAGITVSMKVRPSAGTKGTEKTSIVTAVSAHCTY